jgi:MFS family permease
MGYRLGDGMKSLERNLGLFVAFRICFNARFYYPVLSIFFIDLGLSLEQYAILNLVWAGTIVLSELPSGALADLVGRRPLVLLAGGLMVVEMTVMLLAPAGVGWVFPVLLLNRVISGLAEACASGADEALAFDSLSERGNRDELWSATLAKLGRYQSAAFIVVMLVGAVVYDPAVVGSWAGEPSRLPVLLTLGLAVGAVVCAWRMVEPTSRGEVKGVSLMDPWRQIGRTVRWMGRAPGLVALLAIGMSLDSVVRLFLTLESNFLRMLGYAERWFGLIAAGFAVVAMVVPGLARWMVLRWPVSINFGVAVGMAALGFWGMQQPSVVGATVALGPIAASMSMTGLFVSYYINRQSDSEHRATVLSVRGLVFNVAYGMAGLFYAGYAARGRAGLGEVGENEVFRESMGMFLPWLGVMLAGSVVLGLWAWKADRGNGEDRVG